MKEAIISVTVDILTLIQNTLFVVRYIIANVDDIDLSTGMHVLLKIHVLPNFYRN